MGRTLADIAKEAGVSTATISRVLNGENNVSASTREKVLLALEKENFRFPKEETAAPSGKPKVKKALVGIVNLEDGMPTVEEARADLRISLQSMRSGGFRIVKLIHGYGSTGRGGKICIGVRNELAVMIRKRLIRNYVTGEDFGPYSETSRRIADQYRDITRDPDYGKCNHGITIVVL